MKKKEFTRVFSEGTMNLSKSLWEGSKCRGLCRFLNCSTTLETEKKEKYRRQASFLQVQDQNSSPLYQQKIDPKYLNNQENPKSSQ